MYCLQNGILYYVTNKLYHIYWQILGNIVLKQKYMWRTFDEKYFAYECYYKCTEDQNNYNEKHQKVEMYPRNKIVM